MGGGGEGDVHGMVNRTAQSRWEGGRRSWDGKLNCVKQMGGGGEGDVRGMVNRTAQRGGRR